MPLNRKLNCLSIAFLFSTLITSIAQAETESEHQFNSYIPKGFYLAAFGGGGHGGNISTSQQATAFFSAATGGPQIVDAKGNSGGSGAVGGMNIGYEWQGWKLSENQVASALKPAVELEGFYLANKQHDFLNNPTNRITEHLFDNTFPMNTGVMLANSVFSFKTPYIATPYVGAGIGTAIISVSGATSAQDSPAEPGINHFNSNANASNWVLAAQAKAGLRFNLSKNWNVFAEYRFLYFGATSYTFGSTQYPTHVPTTNWNVNFGDMTYNLGTIGFQYSV